MFQYSTFDTVYNGNYDGGITIQEIKEKGNFGLGTFHQLEGELVAFDNTFYQCAEKNCKLAEKDQKLAWAAVCELSSQQNKMSINKISYEDLRNNKFSYEFKDHLVAIKIEGYFNYIELSSTPKQSKPYPSIQEVIDKSTKYPLKNIKGYLIGWFAPQFMGGIKQPGFHFHFVDEQKKIGGHVLDFQLEDGTFQHQEMKNMVVQFSK